MPTYDEWNKAIISYFFENCEPGEIVFLHTTPETLPEIAEHAGFDVDDAEESLKKAVRKKVVPKNVTSTDEIWLRRISPAEKEPPYVAFLALCVLAASNMETTEKAFHTNYYVPLNILLFDKPNEGRPKGLKYRDWEENWIYLQDWVKDKHDVELYLTQGHPKYVWYPISQCLISKHDEHILHRIFKEMDLKPGAYLAEKQLLDILSSKKSFQNLSVKITRPIDQQKTAEIRLILGQIQLLLKNWDGEVWERIRRGTTRQSSTSISVHLFDLPDDIDEFCFWFRRRQKSQITFNNNDLNVKTLQPYNDQWFEPHVMRANPLSIQMLRNGTELNTTDTKPLTYRIKPSDIWVFRWDREHVGWLSQGNFLLHEEHLIVYSRQLDRNVIPFLQQVCDEQPTSKSIRIGGNGTGWQYIKAKPTRLSDFSLTGFRITTTETEQIKFVGGLPLDRRSNSYIDFCLPSIVVPNLIADSDELFYMNGEPVDIPADRKIELPEKLDSDKYHFSYLDYLQTTLHIIPPKRSLAHQDKTLTTVLSKNRNTIPTYSKETIAEITKKSGVRIGGAKLFGTDIPDITWDDVVEVPIEPLPPKYDKVAPAQLISSVVKLAIELKDNGSLIPEWFDETIQYLDENDAVQTLVQKKLKQYKEKALSFDDLRRYIKG